MAREKKDVPLSKPFDDGKGGKVTKVVVQEPSGSDFLRIGAPQTWVKAPGQVGMALVDNDDAIRAYVERAIVEPDPLLVMANLSLHDAIAVRESVLDFFRASAPTPSA